VLEGNILGYNKDKLVPDAKSISLKNEYFTIDAIILEHINSDEVSLVNKTTGEKITVTVGDFCNLLIWSVPGAPFVCLEPWYGFPDFVDTDGDFTKKHSIIKLAPKATDIKTHIIRV
jgi:galactose mutarotase-like enzyme